MHCNCLSDCVESNLNKSLYCLPPDNIPYIPYISYSD